MILATTTIAATSVIVAAPSVVEAAVIRPFTIRYQADINGSIDLFGNALMTCPPSATCAAAQNPPMGSTTYYANNSFSMINVDADGTAFATLNSSSAIVGYPATATVRFAGLYWGAQSNAGTRNQMKLRGPGDTAYTTVTAAALDASGSAYQGFANVTSFVQARGIGTYWGADVATATGANNYAGWSLVVAWEDSSQPLRNLTVFDGFGVVQNTTADRTITTTLSGFLAPPFGPVQTEVGVITYEGDRGAGATGDAFRLNTTNLSNALNPADDVFNGTISNAGVNEATRNPSYVNSLGYDVDEFNATGILPNSATSATVTLTTGGETYYPGVITTAIDLYAPSFPQQTKTVTNLTRGVDPALPGDVLEYNLSVVNTGLDPANNSVITDPLPANVTFVPGSLAILSGANAGAKTDGAGDDQANYDSASRTVRFRLGTGANATAGGTFIPNASSTARFRVTVDAAAAGSTLTNQFALSYVAQTINRPFTYNSNPVSTPVTPLADLRITKSAGTSPIVAGSPVTYTVTVTNSGPSPAANVVITDSLPAGVSLVSATPSTGTCAATTCTIGTLAFPGTATVTYVVQSSSALPAGSLLANAASVTSTTGDPNRGNETTSITTPVIASADLVVTKSASSPTPIAGGTATWTVTVTNAGPSDAASTTVTDSLPIGLTLVSATPSSGTCVPSGSTVTCSLGAVAAGSVATVAIITTIAADVIGPLTNSATASSPTTDPVPANNTGSATATVAARADLAISKQAVTDPIVPGADAVWTITVVNNGPSDATGVTVTDPAPSGVTWTTASSTLGSCTPGASITCAIGALPAGGSATVTVTGMTASTIADGSSVANTASVTSSTVDPTPGPTTATTNTPVDAQVDLVVAKVATPDPVVSGQPVTYSLTATNNGPSTATNVTVTDAAPPGVTFTGQTPSGGGSCGGSATLVECTFPALAPGVTATVDITASVDPGFVGTAIANVATFDSDQTDPQDATFVNSVGQRADVYLSKSAITPTAIAGTTAQWQLLVGNNGPSDAQNVTFTDDFPAGMTITSIVGGSCSGVGTSSLSCTEAVIASGTSVVVTVTVAVAPAMAAGAASNTANASAATPDDPTASNNTSTANLTVARSADVSITKSTSGPLVPGDPYAFTIDVSNAGPSSATDVVVTDTLAAGLTFDPATSDSRCSAAGQLVTCDLGTLGAAPPTSATTLTIGVVTSPAITNDVGNAASVSSSTPDPDGTDNTSAVTASVTPTADLTIAKLGPASITAGLPATWTVTITNDGPSDARSFTVVDAPPTGVTWTTINADVAGVSCTPATGVCTFAGLPDGASATLTYTGQVAPSTTGSITNFAGITAQATPDPNAANDTANVSAPVATIAELEVAKTPLATPGTAGTQAAWTITVTNTGPSAATAVQLVDTVGAGLTLQSITPSAGTCTLAGSCTLGTIAPGATVTVNVITLVAPDRSGQTLTNTAVASSPVDPTPNAPAVASLPIVGSADLSVVKSAGSASVVAGEELQWTISVENDGPSNAVAATLTDSIPAGFSAVSATPTVGTCTVTTTVECAFGDMTPGQIVFVVVRGRLSPSAPDPSNVVNTVSVTSSTTDPTPTNNTATVTTPVIARSDLRVTKVAATSPFVPGSSVSWTITVVNDGPSDAQAVVVTDVVPTGVSSVSITPAGCTGTTTRTCTLTTLAAGGSFSWTMTGTLSATFAGSTLANTARVMASTIDSDPSDNAATSTTPVAPSADVSVTKSVVGSPVAGGPISWTITIANNGPSAAAAVQVTDVVPAGVSGVGVSPATGCTVGATVTCSYASLAVGTPVVLTLSGTLDSATAPAALIANTAAVTSSTADPNTANNSSTSTTSIGTAADLAVVKTAVGTLAAGSPASWTIQVSNAGPSTARNVVVTDSLPTDLLAPALTIGAGPATCAVAGNLATCAIGDVPSGGSVTITVTGTIDPRHVGAITNRASVTASTPDPSTGNNTDTATDAVDVSADLSIAKSASPATLVAGQPVTYTLIVRNTGPATAVDVTVVDLAPVGVTFETVSTTLGVCDLAVLCALGDVPPGAVVTITINARPDADAPHASDVTNAAAVDSPTTDPDIADRTSVTTNEVRRRADVVAGKVATPVTGTTWEAGERGRYTLTVTNLGPSTSGDLSIVDTLVSDLTFESFLAIDPGLNCTTVGLPTITCTAADLPAGTTLSVVVEVTLDAGATPGNVVNTVGVAQTGADDPDTANNTATTTIGTTTEADLQVDKSTGAVFALSGGTVEWQIVVTNLGPSNATSVTVADVLPAGLTWSSVPAACTIDPGDPARMTCALGTVTPGAGGAITIPVVASVDPGQPAGQVLNTASVASPVADPTVDNNVSSAGVEVLRRADVRIVKTADSPVTIAGTTTTWTLSVTNDGPSTATAVTVSDVLPDGLTFVSAPGCTEEFGLVTCELGTLDPLDTIDIVVTTLVDPGATADITNAAQVASTTPDPTPGNNISDGTTSIESVADLTIAKSADPTDLVAGRPVTYVLVVTNNGPSTAVDVTVDDPMPVGVTFLAVSSTVGSCTLSAACQLGELPPGAVVTMTIIADVDASVTNGSTITNVATVASSTPDDPAGDPNSAQVTSDVERIADLSIVKTFDALDPPNWDAGERGRYTLTLRNDGPSTSGLVTIDDVLPGVVSFAGFVDTPPCSHVAGVVSCSVADLVPNTTIVVEFDVLLDAATVSTDITNAAEVTQSGVTDADPTNDVSSVTTSTSTSADLVVTKQAAAPVAFAGSTATWDITVANAGPSDAADVMVTDTLPAGLTWSTVAPECSTGPDDTITCALGTIAAGAARTLTVEATIDPGQPAGSIVNTATANSSTPDADLSNNTAQGPLTIARAADVSIVKSVASPAVDAGATTSFTFDIANAGPSTAEQTTVTDTLPAGMSFVTGGSDARCTAAGRVVTCDVGALAPASTDTILIIVAVDPDADAGALVNAATVGSSTPDPATADNTSSIGLSIDRSVALRLAKVGIGRFVAGGPAVWQITVDNDGPATSRATRVVDTYPAGFAAADVTTSAGTCTTTALALDCDLGTMQPGATVTITVTGTVDPGTTGTLTNVATVTSSTPNSTPDRATATATEPITVGADLSVTKTGPERVVAGTEAAWTIVTANRGPAVARAVTVVDTAPAGVRFEGAQTDRGTCTVSGTGVTCDLGDLPSGDVATVTVRGTVAAEASGPITNSATVSSNTADPDASDNVAASTSMVDATSDLTVAKSTTSATARVGLNVEWRIDVGNRGPSTATDVIVTDPLPAGLALVALPDGCSASGATVTCERASLAVGATWTIVLVTRATRAGSLTNTASVLSASSDPTPPTATATAVIAPARLPTAGADVHRTLSVAGLLLVLGLVFLTTGRRRPTPTAESLPRP